MTFTPRARAFTAISTGSALRPDSEMITSRSPARSGLESRTALGEAVDPLQRGAERRGHDVDADDARHGQQVHQGEAAGPVDDVLRGERGVAGAEGEEPAAGGDGVGDERPGRLDVGGLLVPHPLQQADRGVEELTGQLAVAHRRTPQTSRRRGSPGPRPAADRRRCRSGWAAAERWPARPYSRRVADHVAVWTSALSIRPAGRVGTARAGSGGPRARGGGAARASGCRDGGTRGASRGPGPRRRGTVVGAMRQNWVQGQRTRRWMSSLRQISSRGTYVRTDRHHGDVSPHHPRAGGGRRGPHARPDRGAARPERPDGQPDGGADGARRSGGGRRATGIWS